MVGSLSHDSAVMGDHNVGATVETLFPVDSSSVFHSRAFILPGYARFALIQHILRSCNATKVCNAVISAVTVNVVNHLRRLLTVIEKPSNPMRFKFRALDPHVPVTAGVEPARNRASPDPSVINLPRQNARLRIVIQDIMDQIRDNFHGHIAPPCGLVKGAGTAILAPYLNNKDRDGTNIRER